MAYTGPLPPGDTLLLTGFYGEQTGKPNQPLTLTYRRPLNRRPFDILAHRGGGRTADLLPASENSLEVIKLASRLGATGIEIDVRFTKDGVPILYHDDVLNLRLTQKNGLVGDVGEFTYQQLSDLVRLVNGEKIPTLEEALETVINHTPLTFVWLDTKFIQSDADDTGYSANSTFRKPKPPAGRFRLLLACPLRMPLTFIRRCPPRIRPFCANSTSLLPAVSMPHLGTPLDHWPGNAGHTRP